MIRHAAKALRTFLASTLDRIYGSAVELESESATELSSRAVSPVDYSLIERQAAAKAALDARGIQPKSARRLVEDHPDEFVPPRFVPEDCQ